MQYDSKQEKKRRKLKKMMIIPKQICTTRNLNWQAEFAFPVALVNYAFRNSFAQMADGLSCMYEITNIQGTAERKSQMNS